jgi:DNA-binding response OmpR family regulator
MLSARNSVADRIQGISEGADDYLPKPFSPAELVARVKAILRRMPGRELPRAPGDQSELRHRDLTIDLDRYEARQGDRLLPLTTTEFRLLATLIAAAGRVLTREQLLDALYGHDDEAVLDRTVDVHVGRLREKLSDPADEPRYIATVRGVGYRVAG